MQRVFGLLIVMAALSGIAKTPDPPPLAPAAPDPIYSVIRNRLPNGMDVWIKPRTNTRAVDVRVVVRTGFRYESPRDSGLSHLVEHMMFKGTRRHTDIELQRIIDSQGGYENGETWPEDTFYEVNIIDRELPRALGWLHEILTESLLSPHALVQARKEVYSEQHGHYPRFLVRIFETGIFQPLEVRLPALAFPQAGVARRVVSDLDHVDSGTIRRFVDNYYAPDNMAIIVVGNVDPADVMRQVTALFGSMHARRGAAPDYLRAGAPRRLRGEITTIGYPPAGQMTTIWRGIWTRGYADPDRWPLLLIDTYLNRRAFEDVRLRHALGYSVGCTRFDLTDVGALWLYAEVTRSRSDERQAKSILDNLIRDLRTQGISPGDLQEAKNTITGRQARGFESNAALAGLYQQRFLTTPYGQPIANTLEEIDRVSAADILRVARTRFADDQLFRATARPVLSYTEVAIACAAAIALIAALFMLMARRRRT